MDPLELLSSAADRGYIGEPISQLAHALQSADLARRARASEELVLAALFHDVGHLIAGEDLEGLGTAHHEELGARFLAERGFGPAVTELVRGHVAAKRYLAWKSAGYEGRLSDASRRTLALQGGPMSDGEAAAFERLPRFRELVQLRKIDEQAKDPAAAPPPLDAYRALVARHSDP